MGADNMEASEKFVNAINVLFTTIAENEPLIYLFGGIVILMFIYSFTRMILDFFGSKRVDSVISENSKALGEVHSVLLIINNKI